MTPKKALLVVSDRGFHWDELADVFHAFHDMHWQIDVASPSGHPKADPLTLRPSWWLHLLGRATTKSRRPRNPWWGRPVVEAMMRAKRLDAVHARDYDAYFVLGGLEGVQDLQNNPALGGLLTQALQENQTIAGRQDVLRGFDFLAGVGRNEAGIYVYGRPQGARRTAWRLLEDLLDPEDLHGWRHIQLRRPEFLDRKSGGVRPRKPFRRAS